MLEPRKLTDNRLARISLFIIGLMWFLPFLEYRHTNPVPSFYSEWWAALLGSLAMILLVFPGSWKPLEIPRIVLLPVTLSVVVLLQTALGKVAYFNQALLFLLYLLFAGMLMVLGAQLRNRFGLAGIAVTLGMFVLAGAELNSLAGMLQYYHLHTPLDTVVLEQIYSGAYGNLSQSNHFADYLSLGLISLGFLYRKRSWKPGYVLLLALPILYAMKLSGSRSVLLYLLLMFGAAWWLEWRDAGKRMLVRYGLLLLLGFAAMFVITRYVAVPAAGGQIAGMVVPRPFGDVASGNIRLYIWRESLLMFMQSPWLGAGLGQFAWNHFQLLPALRANFIHGYFVNGHNIVLHLAAEMGAAGVLALLVPTGIWLYGQRGVAMSLDRWWAYVILGVLTIHSLLEYPMWYTYFLGIAAFLAGALDGNSYRARSGITGSISVAIVVAFVCGLLVNMLIGYGKLERTLAIYPQSPDDQAAYDRIREGLLDAQQHLPLLSQYADITMSGRIQVNPEHLREKLALNSRVLNFHPMGALAYRQALLLAQNGQQQQAKITMEQSIWSFPQWYPEIRRQMVELSGKDPAHFSSLLEFADRVNQEHASAVHQQ